MIMAQQKVNIIIKTNNKNPATSQQFTDLLDEQTYTHIINENCMIYKII